MARFSPQGIFVALITPFDKKGRLDEEGLRELVRFVVEKGVSGVVPCGTTGEFIYMDEKERRRSLETVMDEVSDRVQVIAGTGASSTDTAIRLARHAEDVGANAVLTVAPYFLRPADKGLYQHFYELSKAVDIPIVLYNIPQCTGGFLSREVVEDLAELANVRALKDSSGHLPYMLELLDFVGDRLAILCGHDEVVLPALASGASGAILASANVIPDLWVELFKAIRAGQLERARELQLKVQKLARMIVRHGGPLAVKAALKMMGLRAGRARRPLRSGGSLSWEVREELRLELEKLGKIGGQGQDPDPPQGADLLEELGLGLEDIKAPGVFYGEGSAGSGPEAVDARVLIGPKDSPIGRAWARAFAKLKPGKEALLAVLEPNLTVRPPTLILPEVELRNLRQASMMYGPVQLGVGRAFLEAICSGLLKSDIQRTHVAIIGISMRPEAVDRRTICHNAFSATLSALKSALGGGEV